jgi:hypothetical protein
MMFYRNPDEVLQQAQQHQSEIRELFRRPTEPGPRRTRRWRLPDLNKLWTSVPMRLKDETLWPVLKDYPYPTSDPRYG